VRQLLKKRASTAQDTIRRMSERPAQSGIERRRFPRVPVTLFAREPGQNEEFHEYEGDLSVGGAFIHGKYPLPLSAQPISSFLELRIRLPGEAEEIHVQAQLVSVREEGIANSFHLQFINLDEPSRIAIARYVERAGK
jgi:hypothetical protein